MPGCTWDYGVPTTKKIVRLVPRLLCTKKVNSPYWVYLVAPFGLRLWCSYAETMVFLRQKKTYDYSENIPSYTWMHLDSSFLFFYFHIVRSPRCDREGQRRTEGGDRVVATLSHPEACLGTWGRDSCLCTFPEKRWPRNTGETFLSGKNHWR